jgi:hypothetical protein
VFRLPKIFRPLRPSAAELRVLVDELPLGIRIAMLDGVRTERIITGAYADGVGGVCPMLAAHRHGGRHSHPEFARTWDEFAGAPETGFRDADPKTIAGLVRVLQDSIEHDLRTPEADVDPPRSGRVVEPAAGPVVASRSAPAPHAAASRDDSGAGTGSGDRAAAQAATSTETRPHELLT